MFHHNRTWKPGLFKISDSPVFLYSRYSTRLMRLKFTVEATHDALITLNYMKISLWEFSDTVLQILYFRNFQCYQGSAFFMRETKTAILRIRLKDLLENPRLGIEYPAIFRFIRKNMKLL